MTTPRSDFGIEQAYSLLNSAERACVQRALHDNTEPGRALRIVEHYPDAVCDKHMNEDVRSRILDVLVRLAPDLPARVVNAGLDIDGAYIEPVAGYGNTLLEHAAKQCFEGELEPERVKFLLDLGAKPDAGLPVRGTVLQQLCGSWLRKANLPHTRYVSNAPGANTPTLAQYRLRARFFQHAPVLCQMLLDAGAHASPGDAPDSCGPWDLSPFEQYAGPMRPAALHAHGRPLASLVQASASIWDDPNFRDALQQMVRALAARGALDTPQALEDAMRAPLPTPRETAVMYNLQGALLVVELAPMGPDGTDAHLPVDMIVEAEKIGTIEHDMVELRAAMMQRTARLGAGSAGNLPGNVVDNSAGNSAGNLPAALRPRSVVL